jgi:hypothetical protein
MQLTLTRLVAVSAPGLTYPRPASIAIVVYSCSSECNGAPSASYAGIAMDILPGDCHQQQQQQQRVRTRT